MKRNNFLYTAIPLFVAGLLFFSSCNHSGKKSSAFELTGHLSQPEKSRMERLDCWWSMFYYAGSYHYRNYCMAL